MTLSGPLSALLDNEIQVSRLHTCIDLAFALHNILHITQYLHLMH